MIYVVSGPSGVGKTSLVNFVINNDKDIELSKSITTRKMRDGEVDGDEYYFISVDEFKSHIKNDDFIEYQEVYNGDYYGTLKSEIDRIERSGKECILILDVEGGLNVKKLYGDNVLTIAIEPPFITDLKKRLIDRGTDSYDKISERLIKATSELKKTKLFDKVLVNNDFNICAVKLLALIRSSKK